MGRSGRKQRRRQRTSDRMDTLFSVSAAASTAPLSRSDRFANTAVDSGAPAPSAAPHAARQASAPGSGNGRR